MENKRILITGSKGFLGSHLYKNLAEHNTVIEFEGDVRQPSSNLMNYNMVPDHFLRSKFDIVIHFAGQSDSDEYLDKQKTATTIINGTINILDIAKSHDAKFVFASTAGIYLANPGMVHETCKLAMEQYIRSTYDNYIILRIPRVYDRTRTKGLMRKIREDKITKKDMHRRVEYITINQFLEQTLPLLTRDNIIYDYIIKEKNKIKEIKELFG